MHFLRLVGDPTGSNWCEAIGEHSVPIHLAYIPCLVRLGSCSYDGFPGFLGGRDRSLELWLREMLKTLSSLSLDLQGGLVGALIAL